MKRTLTFIFALIFSVTLFARPSGYPTDKVYQIKTDLDAAELKYDNTSTANADKIQKVIRITYSATSDGGGGSADGTGTSNYDSGIDLPAGAIVTGVWGQVTATFASADSNTLSVIATPSITLYTATDMAGSTTVGDLITGAATDSITHIYNSTAKDIIFVTGTGTSGLTSGEAVYNIEYVMGKPSL